MPFEKEIQVLSVTPTTELSTRANIYQVLIGELVETTPDLKAMTPPGQIPSSSLPAIWLAVNVKMDIVPFKVGSKWKLHVTEEGNLKLERM